MSKGNCYGEGLTKKESFKPSASAPPETRTDVGRTKHEGNVKRTVHNGPRSGSK